MSATTSDPDRNPAFQRRWQEPLAATERVPAAMSAKSDVLGPIGLALMEAWRRDRASRTEP